MWRSQIAFCISENVNGLSVAQGVALYTCAHGQASNLNHDNAPASEETKSWLVRAEIFEPRGRSSDREPPNSE